MRSLLAVVFVAVSATAAVAQVQSRPTDAPLVTAEHEAWYVHGDPVQSAGPAIPLAGSGLVRSADYAGFPVYTNQDGSDTRIYLPALGGRVTPYDRKP